MPWKVTDVMEQRLSFVVQALKGTEKMARLCHQYGISRPTGYHWLRRYKQRSFSGLEDRSRRPRHSPLRTTRGWEERVIQLRERYGWGAKKLQVLLAQEGVNLSVRTVNRILSRQGLVEPGHSHPPATSRFERTVPNELWQMDFKGPMTYHQGGCHPLSVVDDHSRFAVGLYALKSQRWEPVNDCLKNTFKDYGVPQAMLMDHGVPWWSTTNGHGLTRLSVELINQGIDLIHSRVRHPQTQGKVERFHRTLYEAVRHREKRDSIRWQPFLDQFREEYNQVRPHEALQMKVPASRYQPSPRPYQPSPPAWDYPSSVRVTRLSSHGCLATQGRYFFVCEALAKQWVGVESVDGKLLVQYRHMYVREINLRTQQTHPLVCRIHSQKV